jgi:CRP-like cAMP-binding protein
VTKRIVANALGVELRFATAEVTRASRTKGRSAETAEDTSEGSEYTTGDLMLATFDGPAFVGRGDQPNLGPGSFFGEVALLDGGARTATVTATGPMRLLALNRQEFCQLVEYSISSVARKMLTAIGTRLRTMDQALP